MRCPCNWLMMFAHSGPTGDERVSLVSAVSLSMPDSRLHAHSQATAFCRVYFGRLSSRRAYLPRRVSPRQLYEPSPKLSLLFTMPLWDRYRAYYSDITTRTSVGNHRNRISPNQSSTFRQIIGPSVWFVCVRWLAELTPRRWRHCDVGRWNVASYVSSSSSSSLTSWLRRRCRGRQSTTYDATCLSGTATVSLIPRLHDEAGCKRGISLTQSRSTMCKTIAVVTTLPFVVVLTSENQPI